MTNTVSESTILPISGITITPDVNIRELDTDYVSELMQAQVEYGEAHWQTQWKEKPKINQDGILFSGFHTITAAQRNFGNAHEVFFQVVEGNPYILAACENAVHGKRRTNADKRAAVLRWLQDDEGKQWTNRHIAKQCHVSITAVENAEKEMSLSLNGSDRPTKRKYIDKHGNASWMETSKINDATGESEAVISGEKTTGEVLKETALEQLYQNRQDFQTAVSDFAQSGSSLNFTYCRRRIKSLVGLEDATDEGSTDYTHWNLEKIKVQSQMAEESVLVIKGYMDEDPKIEGSPIAALLSEMQRISEIHQSEKLDTYTRPFLIDPLSDAVERIEKLWTSDWEVSKSAEERLDDLNELEAELPSLIEAEDNARAGEKADVEEGTEREAKKLLKQKKQKAKLLWDTRIQVARDYTGDADTELNLHLTLPELEDGFQKNNPHYALHFASAMKRTSEPGYQVMLGRILESEDVTLKVLESEVRAIQTYMGDVRQWQRSDWSPDTNWILPLIEARKAKAADAKKTDAADTLKTLREQITPAIASWKSERKGQGVGHASKTMFLSATKRFHYLPRESETDVDLLEKLLSLLTEVQGRMYTFERYIKMQCDGASIWTDSESDAETSEELPHEPDYELKQREHVNRLEVLPGEIRDYLPTWTSEHAIEGNITLKLLLSARCQIEFDRERGPDPFFREEMEDLLKRMKSNDAALIEKVRELLGEDEDEGLAGIDIHALRVALSSLLETLGVSDMHPGLKDILTGDLLDVFLEYENIPTAKEQIIALLDTADCILSKL